jgi:hypothetical protein
MSLRVSVEHFLNESASLGMGSSRYHAEAGHARRLAEMTIQPNVAQELRRVAEEFDRLADNLAAGEPEYHHPDDGCELVGTHTGCTGFDKYHGV